MVTTVCRNRIFMEPMRHLSIHPRGFIFFPFGAGEGVGWNFYVPIVLSIMFLKFSMGSPWYFPSSPCVPQGCSQYHLTLSHILCPKLSPVHLHIGEPNSILTHWNYYFGEPPKFWFLRKYMVMGNQNGPLKKRKEEKEAELGRHV
jgi:hypothetical protein